MYRGLYISPARNNERQARSASSSLLRLSFLLLSRGRRRHGAGPPPGISPPAPGLLPLLATSPSRNSGSYQSGISYARFRRRQAPTIPGAFIITGGDEQITGGPHGASCRTGSADGGHDGAADRAPDFDDLRGASGVLGADPGNNIDAIRHARVHPQRISDPANAIGSSSPTAVSTLAIPAALLPCLVGRRTGDDGTSHVDPRPGR